MIIKSAGFVSPSLIRSQNALNFAYILYLKLEQQKVQPQMIAKYVKRWIVYSILTQRYSGLPESVFDFDVKQIESKSFDEYLKEIEEGELSDAFWNSQLVQNLDTPVASSPNFHVFLASQVKSGDKGFFSKDISIADLITHRGDIHHLFPKEYLKTYGFQRGKYNQIANYVLIQQEINIKIGKKSPKEYFNIINQQIEDGNFRYGAITTMEDLRQNLQMNCIPESVMDMEFVDYESRTNQTKELIEANRNMLRISSFELMEHNFRENTHSNILEYIFNYIFCGDVSCTILNNLLKQKPYRYWQVPYHLC